MKIKKITNQHRRDFTAIYECEHCGHITDPISGGYDDSYYHNNVIPKKKCNSCGKTAKDDYKPRTPKYPANQIV